MAKTHDIDSLAALLLGIDKERWDEFIEMAADKTAHRLTLGGIVWCIGNGGSAAQASHAAAELIGRMKRDRPPLRAVALADPAVLTCIANDYHDFMMFPRQVEALAAEPDVLWAFSTSGKSANIVNAIGPARRAGCYAVGFTGQGGMLAPCDAVYAVPHQDTARVQEVHCLLVHALVEAIENRFGWAEGAQKSLADGDRRLARNLAMIEGRQL